MALLDHRIDQTHAAGLRRAQGAAGQHQGQGLARTDQTDRAAHAAQARM